MHPFSYNSLRISLFTAQVAEAADFGQGFVRLGDVASLGTEEVAFGLLVVFLQGKEDAAGIVCFGSVSGLGQETGRLFEVSFLHRLIGEGDLGFDGLEVKGLVCNVVLRAAEPGQAILLDFGPV